MIDLHTHSTFSDGSLTPAELVKEAKRIGLTAIALTDHDSTGGLDLFLAACRKHGVTGIPGVEISADCKHGTMHMLGYHINPSEVGLQAVLEKIRDGRSSRNQEIIRKLNELGLELSWNEVKAYAGEDVVGRPHFAQALVARGYVSSKERAFDLYLAKGKPGYIDRLKMTPADSIQAIVGADGIAVLAHPFTLGLGGKDLKKCIEELRDAGLRGMEVFYSEHSPVQVEEYRKLAVELGLVATGGSDFHGKANPRISLGRGFGPLNVPDAVVEDLETARRGGKPANRCS
ncbi:MAG: hypothetical protein C0404_13690 [Verrucomicrobia bacterium]|nr:hypothetical protein [Verrucomicrobiota bacterium]